MQDLNLFVHSKLMEDTKVPKVNEFKYLGSTVPKSGSCKKEVKIRVQVGWNRWRKVSGGDYQLEQCFPTFFYVAAH